MKIIAIDNSGSTSGVEIYWNYVQKLINNSESATKYLFWNSEAKEVSKEIMLEHIQQRKGKNLTYPHVIIPFCENSCPSNLIDLDIVTDGQVSQSDVTDLDNKLTGHKFKSTTIHIIGNSLNLSVAAPFIRASFKYEIITKNKEDQKIISGTPLDLSIYNNNPEKFLKDSETILNKITLENLGRNNVNARNELIKIKTQLVNYIRESKTYQYNELLQELNKALKNGLEKQAHIIASKIVQKDNCSEKDIESIIQKMITRCDGFGQFQFSSQSNRLERADNIDDLELLTTPPVTETISNFECPIYLDKDTPVLLVKKGEGVLQGLPKKYQDAIIDNPLLLLNNPKLVQLIIDRIDNVVGIEAAKVLIESCAPSPYYRQSLSCFISPVIDKSHNKSLKYALANIFFNDNSTNKLVGVPELWLSVVYFAIENITYLQNQGFITILKNTLLNKFRNTLVPMSLSGLFSIKPTVKCSLDVAIWYCACSSPLIFKNGVENRLQNMITAHHLRLLDMFNYPYEKEWIVNRINIYKIFSQMMRMCIKDKYLFEKTLYSRTFQQSIKLTDNTIILIDGPLIENKEIENKEIDDWDKVSKETLYFLGSLVDTQKTFSSITIPNEIPYISLPDPLIMYNPPSNGRIKICSKTCRPYTYDTVTKEHWKICSERLYGPLSKQLSCYNYFIRYVNEKDSYPTQNEFIKWMSEKQYNRGIKTMPINIIQDVKELFEDYNNIMVTITPKEFKNITEKSRCKENRIKMENN